METSAAINSRESQTKEIRVILEGATDIFFNDLSSALTQGATSQDTIPTPPTYTEERAKTIIGALVIDTNSPTATIARAQLAKILETLTTEGDMGKIARINLQATTSQAETEVSTAIPGYEAPQSLSFSNTLKTQIALAIHQALHSRHINGHIEIGARKAAIASIEIAFTNGIVDPTRQIRLALEQHFSEQQTPHSEQIVDEILNHPSVISLINLGKRTLAELTEKIEKVNGDTKEFSAHNINSAATLTTIELLTAEMGSNLNLDRILHASRITETPGENQHNDKQAVPRQHNIELTQRPQEIEPDVLRRIMNKHLAATPPPQKTAQEFRDALSALSTTEQNLLSEREEVRKLELDKERAATTLMTLKEDLTAMERRLETIHLKLNGRPVFQEERYNQEVRVASQAIDNASRRNNREQIAAATSAKEKVENRFSTLRTMLTLGSGALIMEQNKLIEEVKKQRALVLEAESKYRSAEEAFLKGKQQLEKRNNTSNQTVGMDSRTLQDAIEAHGRRVQQITALFLIQRCETLNIKIDSALFSEIERLSEEAPYILNSMVRTARLGHTPNYETEFAQSLKQLLRICMHSSQEMLLATDIVEQISAELFKRDENLDSSRTPHSHHIRLDHIPADQRPIEVGS